MTDECRPGACSIEGGLCDKHMAEAEEMAAGSWISDEARIRADEARAQTERIVAWLRERSGQSARTWHERKDAADAIEVAFPTTGGR